MPGAGAAAEPSAEPASEPAEPVSEPAGGVTVVVEVELFLLPHAANDIATTATTIIIFFMVLVLFLIGLQTRNSNTKAGDYFAGVP
jgi:hypothetical protein